MSENMRIGRGSIAGACLAALFFFAPVSGGSAFASHYRLPADGLVTAKEHRMLEANGLSTTDKVLEYAATKVGRKRLSKYSKIPIPRIVEIVKQCDLLRVDGLGPSMARVLQAAGVEHTGPLSEGDAKAIRKRMEEANRSGQFTKVLPDAKTVADWIAQARRMPRVLKGLP